MVGRSQLCYVSFDFYKRRFKSSGKSLINTLTEVLKKVDKKNIQITINNIYQQFNFFNGEKITPKTFHFNERAIANDRNLALVSFDQVLFKKRPLVKGNDLNKLRQTKLQLLERSRHCDRFFWYKSKQIKASSRVSSEGMFYNEKKNHRCLFREGKKTV